MNTDWEKESGKVGVREKWKNSKMERCEDLRRGGKRRTDG